MDVLASLTDAQLAAVTHGEGPLLVLAGPGSGKTRVITRRVAYLLQQGAAESEILAITFTNKAADEMRRRVDALVPSSRVWISTFHRFCARLLRRYASAVGLEPNYSIYDTRDRLRAIREAMTSLDLDLSHFSPDRVEAAISRAKNDLIGPEQFQERAGDYFHTIVAKIYPLYQRMLRAANAADFDDLLWLTATLLSENPEIRTELDRRYRFVLVDEYQDTNLAQYAIARAMSVEHPNLCATGDPDQAIYGWRGADLNNILKFESDFPSARVVRLEQNYRSTQSILTVANHLIRFNQRRKAKELFTDNATGQRVRLTQYADEQDEARSIARQIRSAVDEGRRRSSDFAIFYRTNALSRVLEEALRAQRIPHQVVSGVAFYERREIKEVLSYLNLLNNPRNDVAFLRVVNVPPRGVGKTTLKRLAAAAEAAGRNLLQAARDAAQVPGLSTRQAALVRRFVELYDRLAQFAGRSVADVVTRVLDESGYRRLLQESLDPKDHGRLENVEELLSAARQYDEAQPEGSLEGFLEESALVTDTDDMEEGAQTVTLMTLHAAKGLEFPVVFIVALEGRLLPHERSADDPAQFEEERRLLFVGITRAQAEVHLSYARTREFRGRRAMTVPSDFIADLPHNEMIVEDVTSTLASEPAESPAPFADRLRSSGPLLTTAAAMAGEAPRQSGAPDAWREGMLVSHPQYGLGRVVALDGVGQNRKATVDFPGSGKRKFVLRSAPLQPVGSR